MLNIAPFFYVCLLFLLLCCCLTFLPLVLIRLTKFTASPDLACQGHTPSASSSLPGSPSSTPQQAPAAHHPAILPLPPAAITRSCQKPVILLFCTHVNVYAHAHTCMSSIQSLQQER